MREGKQMLKAGVVRALGASSASSLDGVRMAVIETDGHRILGFGETSARAYGDDERAVLRAARGQWGGDDVVAATEVVETAHLALLADFEGAELIGFQGLTLTHETGGTGRLQVGCGQRLAAALGRPVVWDFSANDLRLGGQGAPLSPFYHFALARWLQAREPLVILDLGGVGSLTWIDPAKPAPETEGALLAFDTGPATAPLDDLMQARFGQAHDAGGALAAQGEVADGIVAGFLDHPYFYRMPPKTLRRDDFASLQDAVAGLSDADAAATLTACAAMAVVQGMALCPTAPAQVLVAGGGRHNATLMKMLAAGLDCPVAPVEDVGLDGDMIAAQAFAYLAVRVARGLPTTCPATTGVGAAVGGGTLSTP